MIAKHLNVIKNVPQKPHINSANYAMINVLKDIILIQMNVKIIAMVNFIKKIKKEITNVLVIVIVINLFLLQKMNVLMIVL